MRPILEYVNIFWSPTSEKYNNQLEMIQHKAAKATNIYPKKGFYDSFSNSRLLSDLIWKSLEERRTQARLCMVILDPS